MECAETTVYATDGADLGVVFGRYALSACCATGFGICACVFGSSASDACAEAGSDTPLELTAFACLGVDLFLGPSYPAGCCVMVGFVSSA